MSGCRYPGCEWDGPHRPYARARDGVPSASTVASMLDAGKARSFAWAASLIAAVTAVHQPDQWAGLGVDGCTHDKTGLCPACRYLRSQFDRDWKTKAELGTHVHHLALSWAEGNDVDVDPTTSPYMDSLEQFYKQHDPEWVELERTVAYTKPRSHAYRGQIDAVAVINCPACGSGARCRWLLDVKTGSFSPVEQTLQMAGYRFAQHLTDWTSGSQVTTAPMPAVAHTGVLLLRPDYAGRLVELPADGDAHSTFLRLVDLWHWERGMQRWARDHRIDLDNNQPTMKEAVS